MIVHESYESESWNIIYQEEHIKRVLAEIERNFPKYFTSFWQMPKKRMKAIQGVVDEFLGKQPKYQEFLDLEALEEYDYDPAAFKSALRTDVPIILGALHSPDEAMKEFRKNFNIAKGEDLLRVTTNIVKFAENAMADFDDELHEIAETPDDLERVELQDSERFSTSKVIGEGIKSHFLYMLYPNAFPNRGQNSIWSLYFLTDKKNFDLRDYSEFLMVNPDPENNVTEHNYLFPYDLYSFYALKIYLLLKKRSEEEKDYLFTNVYRYIYLDHFFSHIAGEKHKADISLFKTTSKRKDDVYLHGY